MPPDPPSAGMLFAHYECKYLTSPTLTMMTGLVVPPLFKSLDPPLSPRIQHWQTHRWSELRHTHVQVTPDSYIFTVAHSLKSQSYLSHCLELPPRYLANCNIKFWCAASPAASSLVVESDANNTAISLEKAWNQDKMLLMPVVFLCDLVADSTDTNCPSIMVASSGSPSWFCNSLGRSTNSHQQTFSTHFIEIGRMPSLITIEGPAFLAMTSGDVPNGKGSWEDEALVVPSRGSTGRPTPKYTLGNPAWRR